MRTDSICASFSILPPHLGYHIRSTELNWMFPALRPVNCVNCNGEQFDRINSIQIILHISENSPLNIFVETFCNVTLTCYIIIIGIQSLGRSGQRTELSQATGMVLVRCILSRFLGVACHCFSSLSRCSHFSPPGASTSATTWEIQAAELGTVGENVVR